MQQAPNEVRCCIPPYKTSRHKEFNTRAPAWTGIVEAFLLTVQSDGPKTKHGFTSTSLLPTHIAPRRSPNAWFDRQQEKNLIANYHTQIGANAIP